MNEILKDKTIIIPPYLGKNDGGVYYVDCNATGVNDGLSWMNAYQNMASFFNQVKTGSICYVKTR